jgi:hypothetical protein
MPAGVALVAEQGLAAMAFGDVIRLLAYRPCESPYL